MVGAYHELTKELNNHVFFETALKFMAQRLKEANICYCSTHQCRLPPKLVFLVATFLHHQIVLSPPPNCFSSYWHDDNSRSVDAARVRGVLWWRRGPGPSVSMRTSAGAGAGLSLAPLATLLLLLLPTLRAQDIFSGSNSLGKA